MPDRPVPRRACHLRDRANQQVKLEIRGARGRVLAALDLRLHPLMPAT